MLREVRLLESLRHPNIIPYYHSWVDETRFSSFGPPILALHVLMMYASAGNLDAFLLSRSHGAASSSPLSARDVLDADTENMALLPKAERIKAFKRRRQSERPGQRPSETRGVHLLGLDEISKLLADVVEGLAFLVRPSHGWANDSTKTLFSISTSSALMSCCTGRKGRSRPKLYCRTLARLKRCYAAVESAQGTQGLWSTW